jgi:hypothetical protein
MAGTWEIDVELNLTTSGKAFTQTVVGDVLPQPPAISLPAGGTSVVSTTPLISGTPQRLARMDVLGETEGDRIVRDRSRPAALRQRDLRGPRPRGGGPLIPTG